jgi:DNA invertase Pin-like site-specific DNA recombinase
MSAEPLIPAAQYIRMSTEAQQVSLVSQAAVIQRYAETHGFEVVRSYEDHGKSGLMLKHREGLARLLQDVVSGGLPYRAILVYDVSRWGRFQDTDEAAHYEFLCKRSGIPVHYCAETFENDGTPPNAIMKTLRRVMAGEYSRELSVRVFRAHQLVAQRGFRQGGPAGYGLRRIVMSPDGARQQRLGVGEIKTIARGNITLVPGPARELSRIREIYRLIISGERSIRSIAREFNRRGLRYFGGPWTWSGIGEILKNPKYVGCAAWGRTASKLGGRRVRVPQRQWTMRPQAFQAIISQETFDAAQRVLDDKTFRKSNDELLTCLRTLLKSEGRLSAGIIDAARRVPSAYTYYRRFGSLKRAYELIGYRQALRRSEAWKMRRRFSRLRGHLFRLIQKTFRGKVTIIRKTSISRPVVCFDDALKVSVLVCQSVKTPLGHMRWSVPVIAPECNYVTLLCLCNSENDAFEDFYLIPDVNRTGKWFRLKKRDKWLDRGKRILDFSKLRSLAHLISQQKNIPP